MKSEERSSSAGLRCQLSGGIKHKSVFCDECSIIGWACSSTWVHTKGDSDYYQSWPPHQAHWHSAGIHIWKPLFCGGVNTLCTFLYWSITVNASISLPCLLLNQRKIVPIREFCMSCYVCHQWFTHWFKCGIKTRWTLSYQKWCHWRRHMILGKIYKQNWRHCQRLSELMCILTMSQDIHQNIKCTSKDYQPHSDSAFLQGQAMPTDSRWVIVLRSRPDTVASPMLLVS